MGQCCAREGDNFTRVASNSAPVDQDIMRAIRQYACIPTAPIKTFSLYKRDKDDMHLTVTCQNGDTFTWRLKNDGSAADSALYNVGHLIEGYAKDQSAEVA